MAKMRQTHGISKQECPPDFTHQPGDSGTYDTVDSHLLSRACQNFKNIISNPTALVTNAPNMIRAAYFSTEELKATLDAATGAYVRVYYAVLDEDQDSKNFMFMAPTDKFGNALDGANVIYSLCIGENPPCTKPTTGTTDRFIGD